MNFDKLARLQDDLVKDGLPGNDVAVSVAGETVFRRQAGCSDIESGWKTRGDELYFIWSGSKVITTCLGMRLAEEGLLELDAPVSDYLPEYADLFVKKTIDGREEIVRARNVLYVRQLFNMTGGFDYNFAHPSIAEVKKRTNGVCPTREIVRAISQIPLMFEPGERFEYSKCHDILGAIIEIAAGERLRDFARRLIFEPLGMRDTDYGAPSEAIQERMATQYLYRPDLGKPVVMKKVCNYNLGTGFDSGGAGVVSSLDDYLKFAEALANGGESRDGYRLLAPETIALWRKDTLTPTQREDYRRGWGDGYSYGLGVATMVDNAEYGASDGLSDFGWGGAAAMRVHICPEARAAVVFMTHLHDIPNRLKFKKELRNSAFGGIVG